MKDSPFNFINLLSRLKTFQDNEEVNEFISNGLFDPETEIFYSDASDNLQVLVNEIIFLLENLLISKEHFINQGNYIDIVKAGYELEMVSEEVFNSDEHTGSRGTIKTSKCLIVF